MTEELRPEDVAPTATSSLAADHAALLADTLDLPAPDGMLPLLWHWAFFPPRVPTSRLGADGHPTRSAVRALADLPRRMWVGGRLRWTAPLELDQRTERRSTVSAVERKHGRQGELLLVTVRHELSQHGVVVLVEEQDLAHRSASTGPAMPTGTGGARPPTDEERVVAVDVPLLFRWSALTFNTHRIHYDLAYATGVEGYPALVAQGPLVAVLTAGGCDGSGPASFDYRLTAPAFAPGELVLGRHTQDDEESLWARRPDGTEVLRATLRR